jgi:hypothetical protein
MRTDATLDCDELIRGHVIVLGVDYVGYVWSWFQWTVTSSVVTDKLDSRVVNVEQA